MIKKILIANRGEIALRIIRTCKEMGIKTVAVHSTADVHSLHVHYADEDLCIGPGSSKLSYLQPKQILAAAELTNSEAIHPGYGFLSENSEFADMCKENDLIFIGPPGHIIEQLGHKSQAKNSMKKGKVPTIPGSDGIVPNLKAALEIAEKIGYPVIVKAAAGGGGRGMRTAFNKGELEKAFSVASAEAVACFNNGDLYLEKFFVKPRHIEVQLIGDTKGNMIHLGERDCSVQRRHQKLIEESPSPALNATMRKKICETAANGAKHVGYVNAGTMEFLYENGKFYFMEMNTRIQVEHPVTEMVTGVDLIRQQLIVANGDELEFKQKDIMLQGHSIECRINAEDPYHDFRPSPGTITDFNLPGGIGVRVDTHCYSGYVVPPHYDSMVAKLIVHAPTRQKAINRMLRALDEFVIEGISTTIPVLKRILRNPEFVSGDFDTSFLEKHPELLIPEVE